MSEQREAERQNNNKSGRTWSWWQITKRVVLALIFLWVVLLTLLQIPAVQQYIMSQFTNSLSEKTGTTITVDKFRLKFFSDIELNGVYVEDYDGDTLLYAQRFNVNFRNPFVSYISDRFFKIKGLSLSDAVVNVERNPGDSLTNIQRFLTHFEARDTLVTRDREGEFVFELQLDEIIIRNTNFRKRDSLYGSNQNFYVYQALLNPRHIDLKNNEFHLENAYIDSFSVKISNFEGSVSDTSEHGMEEDTNSPVAQNPLLLRVDKLELYNSRFEHHNYDRSPIRTKPDHILDWDHFTVDDIGIDISEFYLHNWTFSGCLDHLEGKTHSGFEITHMQTELVTVDTQEVNVQSAIFETPYSHWSVDVRLLYDEFPDFKEYVDKVEMHIESKEGEVAIEDIITFAPGLEKVRFFNENRMQKVILTGEFDGPVNNFNGDNITFGIGGRSFLRGYFSSRNLAIPEETLLNLEIVESQTSMPDLRKLIPGFNPPSNFNKLGQIRFQGRFDGFYKDFVAYGDMQTEIGRAETDMRMFINEATQKAQYSGKLNLNSFDLGRWTGNSDFGLVNFNAFVSEGEGLTLEELNTSLEATIQELTYKNYTYKNFTMDGTFNKALFEGYFNIEDENVDFSFIGKVNLEQELPTIDVLAEIEEINFQAINITEEEYRLSGNLAAEVSNYNINRLQANFALDSIVLIHNDSIAYTIDSLTGASNYVSRSQKSIELHGNMLDAYISGQYDLENLWPTLQSEIIDYYPEFTNKLGWEKDSIKARPQNFIAELDVHRSKNWPQLLDPQLDSFSNTNISVDWNDAADSFYLDVYSPLLTYGTNQVHDGFVYIRSTEGASNIVVGADSAVIQDRYNLKATTVFGDISADTLFWTINTANYDSLLDNFNLQGKTFIADQHWSSRIANEYLELFNDKWYISPHNLIQIDSSFLRIEDFNMQHEERKIHLRSIDDKGLAIDLEGIQLSLLNDILVYDKLIYAGELTASVRKNDMFRESAMEGTVHVDSLHINEDDYGEFDIEVSAPNANSRVSVVGGFFHPEKKLTFQGNLNTKREELNDNFYDVDIDLNNYPLRILEYFIGDNISKTEGLLNGNFQLTGPLRKPVLNGEAVVSNGAVTIDFLGTRIFIEDQIVRSKENELDVTGAEITDIYGNTAELSGGLVHSYFTDLGLDFRLVTDNFLLLNTKDDGKSLYYGHCMGSAQVDMFGSINTPDINVVAENNPNTQFYLRTDVSTEEVQAGFFRYADLKDTVKSVRTSLETPKGVNFYLDLTANESAEVQIIIDRETGDIIKGRGFGNIQFYLYRTGEINMFGDYEITTGQYLFTAQTIVNKTFPIEEGSTIRWTGDPLEANIDIKARYEVITSPYFFVQDIYTEQSPALTEELQRPTEVVLLVNLTGSLYSPDLDFDIRFPNLTGQAKTYVDNKLSILEDNPGEMYNQAGALIVFNSFLPYGNNSDRVVGGVAYINTLSEFVTSQFSGLLSNLLRSAVEDVEFIDEINLNLKYNVGMGLDEFADESGAYQIESGEFRLKTSARLFERVELDLGGNYGVGNTTLGADESGTYFTGNFAVQYALTEDRRLVLRVYSATDHVLEGRRFRSGVGLRYQREFDSFDKFFEGLKNVLERGKGSDN